MLREGEIFAASKSKQLFQNITKKITNSCIIYRLKLTIYCSDNLFIVLKTWRLKCGNKIKYGIISKYRFENMLNPKRGNYDTRILDI